jgi:hypothetical protein
MFFSFKRASALIAPCAIAFPTLANITANATATIRFCILPSNKTLTCRLIGNARRPMAPTLQMTRIRHVPWQLE